MYITKKQLEKELMETSKKFRKGKDFKPFLMFLTAIGITVSIICLIPLLLFWVALRIIYIPLSILDSFIIKLWRKYNG